MRFYSSTAASGALCSAAPASSALLNPGFPELPPVRRLPADHPGAGSDLHALAPATRRTYETGQRHYANFCRLQCWPICYVSEKSLAWFVAYLADVVRVAPSTIKVYLTGVCALHIKRGYYSSSSLICASLSGVTGPTA